MPKFYFYNICGLIIKSSILFPELVESKSRNSDVIIEYASLKCPSEEFREYNLSDYTKVRITSKGIYILWQNIKICTILDCRKVIINSSTNLDESFLRSLILGYIIAILLHMRGILVLHANAVNMGNGAAVFLGPSGVGKSTISMALHKKGYNLLSDDIVGINLNENNSLLALSGFPRIKLWPEVIKNMGENPDLMPKIHSYINKRSYNTSDKFYHDIKPLKVVYIIEKDNKTCIEDINPQNSLIWLIKSSYCAKMFDDMELCQNLDQCAKIVNNVPIKILKVQHSFKDIPKLIKTIENDVLH